MSYSVKTFAFNMLASTISIALCKLFVLVLIMACKVGSLRERNEKVNEGDVAFEIDESFAQYEKRHLITSSDRQKRFTGKSYYTLLSHY